jgi:rhomboid family GlyGly-CTERM serine protease
MMQFPLTPRFLLPWLVLAVVLIGVWSLPESWVFALTFERDAILAGEWTRVLSGQFVHLSPGHLIGNVLGLVVLWLLYAEYWPRGWFALVAVVCALGSNLGMLLFAPHVGYYVGFSGALYGLVVCGALLDVRNGLRAGWFVLVLALAKVGWEQLIGPISGGFAVNDALAVEAHTFGALTGFILAWCLPRRSVFLHSGA